MSARADLAVIVVSHNHAQWLRACLASVIRGASGLELQLIVVDSGSTDATAAITQREFPAARLVRCENHGFAFANNRGIDAADARHVLFLNPDTEIREGEFSRLLAQVERRRPGAVGVKQVLPDGRFYPTMRRFPSVVNAWGQALGAERLPPPLGRRLRTRELDPRRYEDERPCDWVTGSFLLCPGHVLAEVGGFDERFFLFAEEVDLCLRIKKLGFEVVHMPYMTIVHHVHSGEKLDPAMEAQDAWANVLYAEKHFSRLRRRAFVAALQARYLRNLRGPRAETARRALDTIAERRPPPFAQLTRG